MAQLIFLSCTMFLYTSCGLDEEPVTIIGGTGTGDKDDEKEEPTPTPTRPEKFQMPKLYITLNGYDKKQIDKSTYRDASVKIVDKDAHYSKETELVCNTQIKGHGNSTWGMPKQPYRLKFEEEHKVLGMPANRDWVLLANYSDKSLLRNATAMRTSEILEMSWTPRYRSIEVYIDGSYRGVYTIFEAKEVTKNKVNINVEAGDYYLEIEQTTDEPCHFMTSKCGVPIQFKDPQYPSDAERVRIANYFNEFEEVLYGDDFSDKTNGYAKYIDVESFINNYIIEELAKDIDGNVRKSSFLTLEHDTNKIKFYNVWDFDLCYGNANYFPSGQDGDNGDPNGPRGWWIKDYNTGSVKYGKGWYYRLFKDAAFVAKVKARWVEVYPALYDVPKEIDIWAAELGESPAANFDKWQILDQQVWPNVKVTGSYQGEIDYLKLFYSQRLNWMNTNLPKL